MAFGFRLNIICIVFNKKLRQQYNIMQTSESYVVQIKETYNSSNEFSIEDSATVVDMWRG